MLKTLQIIMFRGFFNVYSSNVTLRELVWIFCDNKVGCYNNHLKVNTWRQLEDHWQRERREERPNGLSFLLPPLLPLVPFSFRNLKKKKIWSNKIKEERPNGLSFLPPTSLPLVSFSYMLLRSSFTFRNLKKKKNLVQ